MRMSHGPLIRWRPSSMPTSFSSADTCRGCHNPGLGGPFRLWHRRSSKALSARPVLSPSGQSLMRVARPILAQRGAPTQAVQNTRPRSAHPSPDRQTHDGGIEGRQRRSGCAMRHQTKNSDLGYPLSAAGCGQLRWSGPRNRVQQSAARRPARPMPRNG